MTCGGARGAGAWPERRHPPARARRWRPAGGPRPRRSRWPMPGRRLQPPERPRRHPAPCTLARRGSGGRATSSRRRICRGQCHLPGTPRSGP
eukprot:2493645-Alexandrium_andersonii.AAC.1